MTAIHGSFLPEFPEKFRLISLDSVDSTNAHAARLAAEGEAGPVWIWAREQTSGRGRRGRDWVSRPGNLYATLLISLPVAGATAAQIGFVAALSIHDMIAGFLGCTDDLCLKWPNDVLLGGRKVSGILTESLGTGTTGDDRISVATGCGVNLAHAPADTRYSAASIAEYRPGAGISPETAMRALAEQFDHWLSIWNNGTGFEAIRTEWLERSFAPGRAMTVRLGEEDVIGAFDGLTSNGALVLEVADGTKRSFHSGEVVNVSLE